MTMPLTLNLDSAAIGTLDRLAEATGNSRDVLVSLALKAYAAREAWQTAKIEAGLAAADDGRFASDEEVLRVRTKLTRVRRAPPITMIMCAA